MKTFKEFFKLGVTKPSKFDVQNYLNHLGTRLMQVPDIVRKIERHFKNIKNLKLDRSGSKVLSFEEVIHEENPCWPGFKQVGMKKKNGKMVPNCVPVDEVAQDKDIKDREGTQPAKYYAGDMSKSTKAARARHFDKKKKGPAPGDATAKTKTSKYTNKYKQMYGEEKLTGLVNKAEKTGISYSILKKVYDRGLAAYKTGHRPGATSQQWAYARVNSFITGGGARKSDNDLWQKAKK